MGLRLPERSVLFPSLALAKLKRGWIVDFFRIFKKFTQGFLEQGTGAAFLDTRSKTEKTFVLFLLKFLFCNASATAVQRSYCEVFVGNCHFSTSLFVYSELSYYRTVFCAHARTVAGCAEPVLEWTRLLGKGCKYWIGIKVR